VVEDVMKAASLALLTTIAAILEAFKTHQIVALRRVLSGQRRTLEPPLTPI
jgi:hypothetical protein